MCLLLLGMSASASNSKSHPRSLPDTTRIYNSDKNNLSSERVPKASFVAEDAAESTSTASGFESRCSRYVRGQLQTSRSQRVHKAWLNEAQEKLLEDGVIEPNAIRSRKHYELRIYSKENTLTSEVTCCYRSEKFPGELKKWHRMGQDNLEDGQVWEAHTFFKRALVLNGRVPDLWHSIAHCYHYVDDFHAARTAYLRSIHFNLSICSVWIDFGTLLETFGWLNDAINVYRQAILLQPDNIDLKEHLAFLCARNA